MAMDLVRSCYTTNMTFFTDNPMEIKVRWFFADPDAKIFPEHHLFGSGNWATDRFEWPGPGEVLDAPRVWQNGEKPDGLIGEHFCGPLKGYTEGTAYPGVPLNTAPDGRCQCCVDLPAVCTDAIEGLPSTLRLRINAIHVFPFTADPSIYSVGQEFDFNRVVPDPGAGPTWTCPDSIFRDFCPFGNLLGFACGQPPGFEVGPCIFEAASAAKFATTSLRWEPFLAEYTINISQQACRNLGYGDESWDCVLFDPAHPPP